MCLRLLDFRFSFIDFFLGNYTGCRPVKSTGNALSDMRNARRRQNRGKCCHGNQRGRPRLPGDVSRATLLARQRKEQINNAKEVSQIWSGNHPRRLEAVNACIKHPGGERHFKDIKSIIDKVRLLP